ncbi:hypothetical protein AX16_009560 [Volvariella volvacea WC 439]|nr:hypothetical protein AX16_009560 [Volvariella volvacea WC 439]
MISDYERQRQLNIAANKALLAELQLDKPLFEPTEKRQKKGPANKKRKADEGAEFQDEPTEPLPKAAKTDDSAAPTASGPRRSSRNANKQVQYNVEKQVGSPKPITHDPDDLHRPERSMSERKHDPKQFGHIPGVPVGAWWETRQACSADSVHAPWVGGISGGPAGAFSIVLSGGYDDNVDLGYAFTYTGCGGRDLKGTKAAPKNLRTAPQSCDQSFDNRRSCETKKPVRVVRGYKLPSRYGPSEGYRYDGLYVVEKAWMDKGMMGYMVCKFLLKRLPGQPPIPVRAIEEDPSAEGLPSTSDDAHSESEETS